MWLESFLALSSAVDAPRTDQIAALRWAGELAGLEGDLPAAQTHLQKSLALARRAGDTYGVAAALRAIGSALFQKGQVAACIAPLSEAIELTRQLGDQRQTAFLLAYVAIAVAHQGDFGRAETLIAESRKLFCALGDTASFEAWIQAYVRVQASAGHHQSPSALPAFRWKSTSRPSSATATLRSMPATSRSSSRSQARPPTRWRRCAMPRRPSSTSCRSSMSRPRRSRARARWSAERFAGPEIGVASTKAFTCQLSVLACLAIAAGKARWGVVWSGCRRTKAGYWRALIEVPGHLAEALMLKSSGRSRAARQGPLEEPRRALSRPRHQSSHWRSKRRAQAQGNLLHPCRRLRRRRAQAARTGSSPRARSRRKRPWAPPPRPSRRTATRCPSRSC